MGFAQLHCHHSSGSMLDSVVSSEELAKRASELGHKYLADTDHGRCSAWYDHNLACLKYGVKPIFGIEQYIVEDEGLMVMNDKGKRTRSKNNHIILLAKNQTGMRNISHLLYISMADTDHFYYNNHNTFSELFKYSEGIICGTACMASPFANALKEGREDKAESLFKTFLDVFKDNFYVELQLNEMVHDIGALKNGQKDINDFLSSLADKYGVPKVITGDVHYLMPEDYKLQDISLAMREKRTVNEAGFTLESRTLYYHDVPDYKAFNERFGYGLTDEQIEQYCSNAEYIASRCDACIPERTKAIFPNVTNEDEYEMERLAKENLAAYCGVDDWQKAPEEYKERLESELNVLKAKGFGNYVMLLWDIFQFCSRENVPVGYARGSGAGSLVLFLLGITKIDSLKNGLLFDRFLSQDRCVDCVVDYWNE